MLPAACIQCAARPQVVRTRASTQPQELSSSNLGKRAILGATQTPGREAVAFAQPRNSIRPYTGFVTWHAWFPSDDLPPAWRPGYQPPSRVSGLVRRCHRRRGLDVCLGRVRPAVDNAALVRLANRGIILAAAVQNFCRPTDCYPRVDQKTAASRCFCSARSGPRTPPWAPFGQNNQRDLPYASYSGSGPTRAVRAYSCSAQRRDRRARPTAPECNGRSAQP
jgi:hypothetical protein